MWLHSVFGYNDLEFNRIGPKGAATIAEMLKINKSLLSISNNQKSGLSVNFLHNEGAKAVADALKVNNSLTELSNRH